MTATTRGRPRSKQADQAIMDATVELLIQHGVSGLSIEGVARRAGVAKTTIYRRWPGKVELALDVLTRLRGPVPEPPAGQSVREDLIFMLNRIWADQSDDASSQLLRRLLTEVTRYPDLHEEYMRRLVVPRRERYIEVFRRGVREGVIRPDTDLALAAEAMIAPVLLGSWIPSRGRIGPEHFPVLVDLILRGLTPPPE